MLDKLKSINAAARELLMWVALPVIALGAFLLYILSENSDLKEEISRKNVEKDLAEADTRASESEKESADEETKFNSAYDQLESHYSEYSRSGVVSPASDGSNVSSPAGPGSDPKEG